MKKYQSFLSENFQFLEMKFSIYLNRRVFVMACFYLTLFTKTTLWHVAQTFMFNVIYYMYYKLTWSFAPGHLMPSLVVHRSSVP